MRSFPRPPSLPPRPSRLPSRRARLFSSGTARFPVGEGPDLRVDHFVEARLHRRGARARAPRRMFLFLRRFLLKPFLRHPARPPATPRRRCSAVDKKPGLGCLRMRYPDSRRITVCGFGGFGSPSSDSTSSRATRSRSAPPDSGKASFRFRSSSSRRSSSPDRIRGVLSPQHVRGEGFDPGDARVHAARAVPGGVDHDQVRRRLRVGGVGGVGGVFFDFPDDAVFDAPLQGNHPPLRRAVRDRGVTGARPVRGTAHPTPAFPSGVREKEQSREPSCRTTRWCSSPAPARTRWRTRTAASTLLSGPAKW